MPRQADHEQRRRQIAQAVWELAAGQGLEDVTLRQVAEKAGVSMRLVQYYFGTRAELLLGALALLNDDAEGIARDRVGFDAGGDPRALVRDVLMELLPLDDDRRLRHRVYAAYFVRFLSDDDLADAAGVGSPSLQDLLAALIGESAGEGVDAVIEAEILVAFAQGLQGQMLLGHVDDRRAIALIDHQLDRIYG